ncbi:MJ0042 family finger-like domain-containing protein [Rhodovulum sp. ES.010]|uniref:zinc-ribbon domain-containing protein n=1 Tax=Rhodovulum sp. ES.010 TaxID=1882821 RepID=UPI00092AE3F2|nr:zinc-ribbon domain-containing protein [Rhodovulum sp. ES.010]SIO43304.1 MJ0042 family finger-like domain-containing protein [Rhodovulum sp. ES.010]
MRLICPNCEAQYEVDDAVIPREGRDVQCSNCGHIWFQQAAGTPAPESPMADAAPGADQPPAPPPERAGAGSTEQAADADPAPEADQPMPPEPPVSAPKQEEPAGEDDATAPASTPGTARRELDADVLNILKEEAEREQRAREEEAAVETFADQPDLGLEPADSPAERAVVETAVQRPAPAAQAPEAAAPRRDTLPDIEEINSTLTASSDRGADSIVTAEAEAAGQRSGFRLGFALVVLIGAAAVAVYLFAPSIAGLHPALDGPIQAYVEAIDGARLWLHAKMPEALEGVTGAPDGTGG